MVQNVLYVFSVPFQSIHLEPHIYDTTVTIQFLRSSACDEHLHEAGWLGAATYFCLNCRLQPT